MNKNKSIEKMKCFQCGKEFYVFGQGKKNKLPKKGAFKCDACKLGFPPGGQVLWVE